MENNSIVTFPIESPMVEAMLSANNLLQSINNFFKYVGEVNGELNVDPMLVQSLFTARGLLHKMRGIEEEPKE